MNKDMQRMLDPNWDLIRTIYISPGIVRLSNKRVCCEARPLFAEGVVQWLLGLPSLQ